MVSEPQLLIRKQPDLSRVVAALCLGLLAVSGCVSEERIKKADGFYQEGVAVLTGGDQQGAYVSFQKALQENPRHRDAHYYVAFIYANQEKFDLAEAEIREAIRTDPDYPEAYNFLGPRAHPRHLPQIQRDDRALQRHGPRDSRRCAGCRFPMASEAVGAALAFQAANAAHLSRLADAVRPVLRVGIAMGEVIVADHTVTGDGVVLAQRLEQLAEPGGVVIQGAAHETVPKRLPFDYADLGEIELKGFDEAVRAFAVRLRPGESVPAPDYAGGKVRHAAGAPENDVASADLIADQGRPSHVVEQPGQHSGGRRRRVFGMGRAQRVQTIVHRPGIHSPGQHE